MSKILEMRQKRAEVWDRARAFLDERTNENGVMSAEDSQQYERMEQEVVDLGHTIDRMERAEQMHFPAFENDSAPARAAPLLPHPCDSQCVLPQNPWGTSADRPHRR